MTASPAYRTVSARAELWPEVKTGASRLAPATVLGSIVMCGVGYLLTHPLANAGFTRWEGGLDRWFAHHRTPSWNSIPKFASLAAMVGRDRPTCPS